MSHIQVDLKVIEGLAASVARGGGVSEDRVLAGLVRLWHRVWASEADRFGRGQLAGVFGAEGLDVLTSNLCEFGFLEQTSEDEWRVRGAARYLRLKASRRLGAEKTNASRSRAHGSDALERAVACAPERSTTEHRTPNTEEEDLLRAKQPRAAKLKKPPDPRHTPLVQALCDAYGEVLGSRYGFTGRDAKHVAQLLDLGPPEEVLARWRLALTRSRDKYQPGKVRTLARLVEHWNDYPVAPAGPASVCAVCGAPADTGIGEVLLCYGRCQTAWHAHAAALEGQEPWKRVNEWVAAQRALLGEDNLRRTA